MKKVLLVVALLLLATPVFAASDVTVTATKVGTPVGSVQKVAIGYTGAATADAIRAFALSITLDLTADANIQNLADFNRGESNKPGGGYGIFPARFRQYITPLNGNTVTSTGGYGWADANYNPAAVWGDVNAGWGVGTKWLVTELGTLYQGDGNAPGTSGTLFTIDVNGTGDCNLCVALDQIRGGVVKKDTTAATVDLPPGSPPGTPAGCIKISFTPPCTYVVPNVVGMSRANALSALASNNCVAGTEVNGFGGATAVGSAYAQSVPAGTSACPGPVTVALSIASYPIKSSATTNAMYANWVTMGKPACWAYPRQCKGDADGKKLGNYWVSNNDLIVLKSALSKLQSVIPTGGICASFTHKKLGNYWVSNNDLIVLKGSLSKLESLVPVCGTPGVADPNYWYFCVPTGATCPAGVTCGTVGVCPNTP